MRSKEVETMRYSYMKERREQQHCVTDAGMRAKYSRLPSVVLYACLSDRGVAQFDTRLDPGLKAICLTQAFSLGQKV